jgi:hypothetical protein
MSGKKRPAHESAPIRSLLREPAIPLFDAVCTPGSRSPIGRLDSEALNFLHFDDLTFPATPISGSHAAGTRFLLP